MSIWVGAFLTGILSAVLCLILIWLGPKDAPDGGRKQQVRAVPTAGGFAIFGAMFLVVFAGAFQGDNVERYYHLLNMHGIQPFLILLLITFFIGLMDDWLTVPTRLKLVGFLLLSLVTSFFAIEDVNANFSFPGVSLVLPTLLTSLGAALWIFVFANSSNFMDGSNGLAMGCLAIMLAALGYLSSVSSDLFGLGRLNALQTGIIFMLFAIGGFLILNLRGLIYAGDSGSLTLGTLFAVVSLLLLIYLDWGRLQVWTPATLALPFLIDTILTVIWRAKHKRNLLKGHLDHAYQLFRRSGWGHVRVAALWWGLTIIAAIAAILADRAGGDAPFWVWLALLMMGSTAWTWQRRVYGERVRQLGT